MRMGQGKRRLGGRLGAAVLSGTMVAGVMGAAAAFASRDAETVHACVAQKGGAVRIVADPDACSAKSEYATQWNVQGPPGEPGPQGEQGLQGETGPQPDLSAGSIQTLHLDTTPGPEAVATATIRDGAVTDAKIASLDAGKLTGVVNAFQVSGTLESATVLASSILGQVQWHQIANAAVTAGKLIKASDKRVDGDVGFGDAGITGILNEHIELGTIAGDRLAPGAIGTAQLATDAVTTAQRKANAQMGWGLGSTLHDGAPAASLAGPSLTIPTASPAGPHLVLVTGEVTLSCSACTGQQTVTYQVRATQGDDVRQVGVVRSVTLQPGQSTVAAFSGIHGVDVGRRDYHLDVALGSPGGQMVDAMLPLINVVDLGRQ